MKRLLLALTVFSFVFFGTGCGQSGPLYIADDPSTISHPPPPEEEAEESDEAEDNDSDKN